MFPQLKLKNHEVELGPIFLNSEMFLKIMKVTHVVIMRFMNSGIPIFFFKLGTTKLTLHPSFIVKSSRTDGCTLFVLNDHLVALNHFARLKHLDAV